MLSLLRYQFFLFIKESSQTFHKGHLLASFASLNSEIYRVIWQGPFTNSFDEFKQLWDKNEYFHLGTFRVRDDGFGFNSFDKLFFLDFYFVFTYILSTCKVLVSKA